MKMKSKYEKRKSKKKNEFYIAYNEKNGEVQIYHVKTNKRGVTEAVKYGKDDEYSYKPTRWQRFIWKIKSKWNKIFSVKPRTKKRVKL